MPPLCSMVFMPRGVIRRRTVWPSASDRTEPTCRLDMNRRRVLLLAWLTLFRTGRLCPTGRNDGAWRYPLKNDPAGRREGRLFTGRRGASQGSPSSEPVHDPFADILDLILRNHPSAGRD